MKYLLDSNTLIEAKNRYYSMTVCPAYWLWLIQKNQSHDVASITSVSKELREGKDELAEWAIANPEIFLEVDDDETQINFGEVANLVFGKAATMKTGAVEEFLSGADPWLIAKAMTTKATVVTHEAFHADVKRKFLIPNICRHFGVSWINTFEMLDTLEARFVLPA
ncbi:DUF4411 family protein [Oxalobacteraceae bacterium]|nr:DUF4411 family protein [Oxalobacteraceae bacterium]